MPFLKNGFNGHSFYSLHPKIAKQVIMGKLEKKRNLQISDHKNLKFMNKIYE